MTTEIIAIPDAAEWTAAEVDQWLNRRNGWAKRHIVELGGYRDGLRYKFPIHGVRAFQTRQAQEYAERRGEA